MIPGGGRDFHLALGILWGCLHVRFVTILYTDYFSPYRFLPCSTDRGGLKDAHTVEVLQEKFLECLRREIGRREERDNHLFAKLLMKMPLLRSISTVQQENTLCFRMENPKVVLPPLLVELNDLTNIQETDIPMGPAYL